MKKISFVMLAGFMLGFVAVSAQCVINNSNIAPGITAVNANDTLTQGVLYGQSFQIYIPAAYQGTAIDSVHITLTGIPAGPVLIYEPADGNGVTIAGGGNGVICMEGTTYDAAGAYPVTFGGTVYMGGTTVPLSSLPANFSYTFHVKAPALPGYTCDTAVNINLGYDDTTIVGIGPVNIGYLSGNGDIFANAQYYPFVAIAEKLTGGVGDSVTGAMAQFGYVTINPADSDKLVGVYLYNATGPLVTGAATGGPGNALDSAFVTLKTIADDVNDDAFTNVAFNGGVVLTTPRFFIVVKLPTTPGDTVVVFTNNATTANGAGYLDIGGYGWISYTSAAGLSADSLGNFIGATICGNAPVAPDAGFNASAGDACFGTTVNFNNVTSNNPTSFSWNFGDGTPGSTILDPSHLYADTGIYLVTLVAGNAGGSVTYSAYLYIVPNPTATGVVTNATGASVADGSVLVTATSGAPPFTFEWSTGASLTGTLKDTLMSVLPGTYQVSIIDSNSCLVVDTFTVSYPFGISSTGAGVQIKIYPNPANDVLNFVWNRNAEAVVDFYDLTGALVKTCTISGAGVNRFDIHNLPAGAYIICITDKQDNSTQGLPFEKF